MTKLDVTLEQFFKTVAKRPQRKFEETLTSFNRDVYWYDKDEIKRQQEVNTRNKEQTTNYEDHRKAIETSINFFHKRTQHEIALNILTHRHFKDYRNKTFKGNGNFYDDYSTIVKKIGTIFDHKQSRLISSSLKLNLSTYKTPTLVQINHIVNIASKVTLPNTKLSLQEWCNLFNSGAPESTTYKVVG